MTVPPKYSHPAAWVNSYPRQTQIQTIHFELGIWQTKDITAETWYHYCWPHSFISHFRRSHLIHHTVSPLRITNYSSQVTTMVTGKGVYLPQSSRMKATEPSTFCTFLSSPCGPGARATFLCLNKARNISVRATCVT